MRNSLIKVALNNLDENISGSEYDEIVETVTPSVIKDILAEFSFCNVLYKNDESDDGLIVMEIDGSKIIVHSDENWSEDAPSKWFVLMTIMPFELPSSCISEMNLVFFRDRIGHIEKTMTNMTAFKSKIFTDGGVTRKHIYIMIQNFLSNVITVNKECLEKYEMENSST